MKSDLLALSTILLWGSLAALSVSLSHLPPLLLTGLGLIVGSLISLPLMKFKLSGWRVSPSTLALGVYGLFGFHFLLFVALQNAPAAQANLVNYLWPVLLVVITPLFLRGLRLNPWHFVAVALGFAGAAVAILGGSSAGAAEQISGEGLDATVAMGYLAAFGAAVVWATYSVLTKRVAHFETSAIGLFALVAGLLALVSHVLFEPAAELTGRDWLLVALLGLGPLGGAFYLWDAAIKLGDTRRLGILAFLTPLISTSLLLASQGLALTWSLALATALIIVAAVIGAWAGRLARNQESLASAGAGEPQSAKVTIRQEIGEQSV
jgi:drug/metabolite transporter (DMT)-like permease